MGADRSENEPDEYDPEAEFRDPDSDSITIPSVSTEDAGSGLRSDLRSELEADKTTPDLSTGDADVSSELLTEFWALVLVINAAVLAYALALLLLLFEGATTSAAVLLAAALALTGLTVRRYRSVKRTEFSSPDDDADDATTDEADDSTTDDGDETATDNTDTGDSTDEAAADGPDDADGVPDEERSDRP